MARLLLYFGSSEYSLRVLVETIRFQFGNAYGLKFVRFSAKMQHKITERLPPLPLGINSVDLGRS